MTETKNTIPNWFWIVFGILLVWNLLGVMAFVMQMAITPEQISAMPVEEQQLYAELPVWVTIAFACAVFGGSLGCALGLLKKALAKTVLIISLVGVLVQMSHTFFISDAWEIYGPGSAIMPAMVVVIAIFLVWFSGLGIKNGWLK